VSVPEHRSFSQLSTFLKCAHQYYLSKVAGVPEKPAVYLVAGKAVHELIELVNHDLYRERMQDG
jgi:CRISPR/Cas system-associated exonuclease Cas4 (RecB family)